ncbi:MAG TPA: acyl-CoA dehydrogenase family protein [Candidatus Lokiarchaeia archaeon]|nr:acyl-CoA dehydrogenase family protein [Candidatus Lokiarchaeia archaeon]
MDFSLTEEQLKLQAKARDFALKEILPIVHYFDENDQMPLYILKKAHAAGLTNLSIPAAYNGKGLGLTDEVIVTEEFAAVDPGMATSIFDNTLGEEPLMMSENEEAKQKYLPMLVEEPKLVSFATSEPMMGSDVAGIRCHAEKDGDDYILNGTKYWITNAGFADYCSVFATVDPELKHKGIASFFVDMKSDGVTVGEHIPKLGQRSSNTAAIKFTDCRVPAENVLAPEGKGFALAMKTFSRTRPSIGSFAVGAARSAMEYAIDYVKKRRAFGQALVDFQNTQFRIAEMYQKVETMRLLMYKAAWEADSGMDPTISASLAKFYTTEAAFEVVNQALQFFAGYGYTKFYPIEKLLRDLRVLTIYEGTSEVQRIVVSRHALNEYKPVMPPLEDLPSLRADDPNVAALEGIDPTQTVWRCRICGALYYGDEPPEECEYCKFPKSAFKKVWPPES